MWLERGTGDIPQEDILRQKSIGEVQKIGVSDALERGDYETVGELRYQTHFGLSGLYEVCCEELDFLNKLAASAGDGSRVMAGD